MRDILFRGKTVGGVWEYGVPVFSGLNNELAFMKQMHSYDHRVIPETVGQYTGLTDKNGKKIFEGDILDHTIQAEVLTNRGVVAWDCENARWALQLNTMKPCFYMHNPKAVEVIGNIHDNPELLEVQK